jgi:vacuolar-type H+-ATPase subunit I/STV1
MPPALHSLLLVSSAVTWFLVFICWIAQKSADYVTKHSHTHEHTEKKSSSSVATHSHGTQTVSELAKLRDMFTAELNDIKDEVRLKDDEISKLKQQISNLETQVQIEALKAELANLKALAAKERTRRKKD